MILDDALLDRAMRLTGISEKTAVVHAGLRALISQLSANRLAQLGGSDTKAESAPRRRDGARRQ